MSDGVDWPVKNNGVCYSLMEEGIVYRDAGKIEKISINTRILKIVIFGCFLKTQFTVRFPTQTFPSPEKTLQTFVYKFASER